jgi:type IV pilus assembly protein PilC
MEADLPLATKLLLALTGRLRAALPVVALGVTCAVVAAWQWRRTPGGRRAMDAVLLHVPWVGQILEGYLFSRVARTLAMMLAGGIPMIPSLKTTLATVGNTYVSESLAVAIPRVAAGTSLANALAASSVAPPLLLELVTVGESSGALGEMLGHVADLYDGEMDTRLAMLSAAIEPIIMIGMGLVVASIVVIMYLPVFHLASVVH